MAERDGLRAGWRPFGLGDRKPHHFLEMLQVAWENREHPAYAWRVLTEGVCDGCALGTSGLSDWTIDGTHLCMVRLKLLRLNTMDALDETVLADMDGLAKLDDAGLRELGRLAWPMVRRRGDRGFRRVGWDEALHAIGARLRATDPKRMACYMTSRGLTNEVYYVAQKAWRLLGSPNIDNAARLCHSPSTAAMKRTLGVAASTCSYRDWLEAEVIVFFGSNPANDQPVSIKYLLEARRRGARVFAVNTYEEPGMKKYWVPSDVESALFGTNVVERFFSVHTGGDLAFVCAVQKRLLDLGAVDRAFVESHTENFEAWAAHLRSLDAARLRQWAGVSEDDVDALAKLLAGAQRAVFVWSMGITQHAHGADSVAAICNLGLMRGFVGRDGAGLMPIRGHSGVQGGAEMGAYATALPGGLSASDPDARARFEALWGFPVPPGPGMHTVEMVRAAGRGDLDVLYTMGGNFLATLPQPAMVREALARVPVRLHQDIVLTRQMLVDPAEEAWLLPACTRYEQEGGGTETTTERRVVFSPHIPGHPVGEARSEWRIVLDLARAARPEAAHLLDFADGPAVRAEIERAVPQYAGIAALSKKGDQFQYGGRHLCAGGVFPRPGGRAAFAVVEPPERGLKDGQLYLATRRGKQFNSIVQREIDPLTGAARLDLLMAAEDVAARSLREGQGVRVVSAHGAVEARVRVARVRPGNVQMHWPEANPLLPEDRLDPGGLVPDYNAAVTVTPLP
jgi:molybdopterin-dependent oxidoreductase alpha subunit